MNIIIDDGDKKVRDSQSCNCKNMYTYPFQSLLVQFLLKKFPLPSSLYDVLKAKELLHEDPTDKSRN